MSELIPVHALIVGGEKPDKYKEGQFKRSVCFVDRTVPIGTNLDDIADDGKRWVNFRPPYEGLPAKGEKGYVTQQKSPQGGTYYKFHRDPDAAPSSPPAQQQSQQASVSQQGEQKAPTFENVAATLARCTDFARDRLWPKDTDATAVQASAATLFIQVARMGLWQEDADDTLRKASAFLRGGPSVGAILSSIDRIKGLVPKSDFQSYLVNALEVASDRHSMDVEESEAILNTVRVYSDLLPSDKRAEYARRASIEEQEKPF